MAILAGDGLLSAAFELIHKDYLLHMADAKALKRRLRAGGAIAVGCGCRGMVAGQAADIEAEGQIASAELIDYIHINKTAALMRASTEAGAWIGGATQAGARALADYGENLGLAFQIADDILDRTGEKSVIGKTPGKDAKKGKAAYPELHGLDVSRERLLELTDRAVSAAAGAEKTDARYIEIMQEMAHSLARRLK
jgi:geranylgeranyl diphosphate synthase type II